MLVLYVLLFFVLNIVLTRFLFKKTKLLIIPSLVSCLISLAHSVIMFMYAEFYGVYSDNFICLSAGYFIYDMFNTLNKKITKESIVYIIHHVFALMAYYIVLTNEDVRKSLPILTFAVGKIELTSAISHFVVIFDLIQYKRGMTILKIFNIITWIYYRLISTYLLRESLFAGNLIYASIAIIIISVAGLLNFIKNLFDENN